jgi:hypothetical protein
MSLLLNCTFCNKHFGSPAVKKTLIISGSGAALAAEEQSQPVGHPAAAAGVRPALPGRGRLRLTGRATTGRLPSPGTGKIKIKQ